MTDEECWTSANILVCGNIKGLQDRYHNPTTRAGFAKRRGRRRTWLQASLTARGDTLDGLGGYETYGLRENADRHIRKACSQWVSPKVAV